MLVFGFVSANFAKNCSVGFVQTGVYPAEGDTDLVERQSDLSDVLCLNGWGEPLCQAIERLDETTDHFRSSRLRFIEKISQHPSNRLREKERVSARLGGHENLIIAEVSPSGIGQFT